MTRLPQGAFVEVADRVAGSFFDAGCGTGENALFYAGRGHPVLDIDLLDYPIHEARRKAQELGLDDEFTRMDTLTLGELDLQFDSVIDSGLFPFLSDGDCIGYVAGLSHVIRPGGRPLLLCFSDEEPGTQGPRRVTQEVIRQAFDKSRVVEEIRASGFEVRSDLEGISSGEGRPKVWSSTIRRRG